MDLSQLGASGAVVIVVILFLNFMKEEGKKRDETYAKVAIALDSVTGATRQNTAATENADNYLQQRNGRDIESHKETLIAIQAIPDTMQQIADDQVIAITKALTRTTTQVKQQQVEHQVVKETVIDRRKGDES